MLDESTFKTVILSVPIVSIDILVINKNKVLLGKRVNKPAQGFFFSTGGRIMKNESIDQAINRISMNELNIKLTSEPKFIGVFEHFYHDSIFNNVSAHYVNLAYEYKLSDIDNLPMEQHSEYKWFRIDLLEQSSQVHKYVKKYFRK
jgi:colanic acid biosynthesis protein WcaH